jgi:hypothetical protein
MFFFCFCSSPPQSTTQFDYQSAEAMLEVIQAIHDKAGIETVEKLLDNALQMEAYQITEERYTNPNRSKKDQVTLPEYKMFILSFLEDSVDTQGNRRLGFLKDLYRDAVKNPQKYAEALKRIKAIKGSQIQEALDIALYWLPEGIEVHTSAIILFDMGGGGWAYKTKDGRHHTAFNILVLLDENGTFDQDNFLGTLAHELHHVGIPVDSFYNTITYDSLNDTSRLKLYTDFVKPMITEGLAQKFCSNAPGKFSPKPYLEKKFASNETAHQNWEYFNSHLIDIHKRAMSDLTKILNGEITNPDAFNTAFKNYWTWHAGELEGKRFVQGRRYYYGAEILGVINEGLGREALFEVIYDFRKFLPLYNKGLRELEPEGYEEYLFPVDIIQSVEEL